MRTLSSTLLAAQKKVTRTPYLKVEIKNRIGAATRLDFQRIYTGSENNYLHAATSPGDGSLIRARISISPTNLYRQRVTNPGQGSNFSQWTLIEAVGWTAGTALASSGGNVIHLWVGTDFKTIKYQESSDNGANFGGIQTLFVTQEAIYHLAAAMKPNGDIALFFWQVDTVKVITRISGVWSAYSGLQEYYASGDDTGDGAIYGNNWQAQTFTAEKAYRITSVRLKLYRLGLPGTITVSIRATDASDHPTGPDLCSGTTNGNTLTTSSAGQERDIYFGAGYPLTYGVKYAIVVRCGGDVNNCFYWREDSTTPTYAGGYVEISSNGGSSWTGYSGRDKWFRNYGWYPRDWSNTLSVCSGLAASYLSDWNLAVTGRDVSDKRGVWTFLYGDGGSAPVNTWTALKEILLAEIDSNTDYKYPSLTYDGTVHRLTLQEVFAATEIYSRPYLSFQTPQSTYLDNLWREPYPFNLLCDYGLAITKAPTKVFLTTPYGVWQATLSPTPFDLTPDVLALKQEIGRQDSSRGSPGLSVELSNDQGQYANFAQKGCEILVSPGYQTTAGDECSSGPSFWIQGWEYLSQPSKSSIVIYATDAWGLLESWVARYQLTWAIDTKTVKEILIYLLSRIGIPLSVQSQSTLITTFKPAFTLYPGESAASAIKRLLAMVPDVLFFREATAYLKNPQTSDATVYSYGTDHPIFQGRYKEEAMNTNRVQVWGTQTPHIMVDRFAWDDLEDVYDRLQQVRDLNINTVALAQQRADALLREAEIEATDGEISVPMNCGQELWDVIEVTDARVNFQVKKYRLRGLEILYSIHKSEYRLKMRLGAL
jgi:hypothetical protein